MEKARAIMPSGPRQVTAVTAIELATAVATAMATTRVGGPRAAIAGSAAAAIARPRTATMGTAAIPATTLLTGTETSHGEMSPTTFPLVTAL